MFSFLPCLPPIALSPLPPSLLSSPYPVPAYIGIITIAIIVVLVLIFAAIGVARWRAGRRRRAAAAITSQVSY